MKLLKFLLTRLLRGATRFYTTAVLEIAFLLTRLLRGATTGRDSRPIPDRISTHTPLARRDILGRCV